MDVDDLYAFEHRARARGHPRIAGVDEVGRGPLAGPVVAAAVILPAAGVPVPVADSKTLDAARRQALDAALRQTDGVLIGLASVSSARIDEINILRATAEAMDLALRALSPAPDWVLIDGRPLPAWPWPSEFIVKGDARSASIAAASIVAKVYRDALMVDLDRQYPGYGFARHKGYGTREHLEALAARGPTPVHRRSFAPLARRAEPPPRQMELPWRP